MRTLRSRRGISLIDMMISISILMVVTTFTVLSIRNAIALNQGMKAQDTSLRAPLMKLRRELQLAFLTQDLSSTLTYRTVFVGENTDPDTLWFATRAHQRLYRDARESDQAEITLWADDMPRVDGLDDEGLVLFHRESGRVDHEPGEGGLIHPLAYNLRSFDLRYLDGLTNQWKDEWDSRSSEHLNRLPRAVEISMVALVPDPKNPGKYIEKPHKTTVELQFADPIVQQSADGQGFGR